MEGSDFKILSDQRVLANNKLAAGRLSLSFEFVNSVSLSKVHMGS